MFSNVPFDELFVKYQWVRTWDITHNVKSHGTLSVEILYKDRYISKDILF
jgi:hypothetical protein